MAITLKGIDQVIKLYPLRVEGDNDLILKLRANSYKWMKVSEIVRQVAYLVSGIFAGLEILAKIFLIA